MLACLTFSLCAENMNSGSNACKAITLLKEHLLSHSDQPEKALKVPTNMT